jgi:hypothetical protein
MINLSFLQWRRRLSDIEIDGEDSFQFFKWYLEHEYEQRLLESTSLCGEESFVHLNEQRLHIMELDELESIFIESEEYEKCAAVRDLRAALRLKYRLDQVSVTSVS